MRRKKIRATKKNKEIIQKYKKSSKGLRSIGLTCKKCQARVRINTSRPEIYTKEVRENYVCLNCRMREK